MNDRQKPPSPFLASRIIRGIALTFVALWLFYVLYDDPTRGSVNLAVSRIYLSLASLLIVLAFGFNTVASCVKILEERLKRLEQTHPQAQSRPDAT
jgi:hypothetical protein